MYIKTLIILLFSVNVYGQTNISINGSGTPVKINGSGTGLTVNYQAWVTQGTIADDGFYNGFPMIADAEDRTTYGVYKKSTSHASGGALMLIKTTDGGHTWTEDTIYVDGSLITSTNHSFQRLSSGRMLISYRVGGVMYFAYNDNNDRNFTASATTVSPATDYIVVQSPIKMLEMPSGNVLFAYYAVGSNGNPASQELMRSTDNGQTFTAYSQIHEGDSTVAQGGTLGNWRGNEVAIAITHNTGIDSTCKMIAIVRTEVSDDGGTYGMVFMSNDGGNTWTKDLTTDPGSFINDNGQTVTNLSPGLSRHLLYSFLASNSPVDIRLFKDSVYVVMGERNVTYGHALKVIAATPDGAFQNKWDNWTRPRLIKMYTAGGSTYDHGYPVLFTANNKLYAAEYDMSAEATVPELSSKRVLSEIIKIKD
jgi:hypothetical protein